MRSASLRHALLTAAAAFLTACTSSDATPVGSTTNPSETRLFLVLSSQVDTVPEATSRPVVARVTDAQGVLKSAHVSWLSTDPAVATVSAGIIAGIAPGTAKVIASTTGAADTVDVVVTPNELTLDVQPSAAAIAMGESLQFVATMRSRSGDVISVNSFTWSSSDSDAVKLLGPGAVQTLREGTVRISAEALRRRGESEVQVFRQTVASVSINPSTANVYPGDSLELEVTLRDGNGREIRNGDVTFGSSDFTKATVTQDGVVVGKAQGSVVITATSGSKTASATVNVLGAVAASLQLVLPSDTTLVGLEMQAEAIALDAQGNTLEGRTIAWQSANTSVATVTSTGVIKGYVEGSTNISAISDGKIATRKVTVRSRPAASIAILPSAPSVMAGQTAQLVAQVLDQGGVEISGQQVTWSSSTPGVVSVSASGLLTGVSSGTATITATSGSMSATVVASVTSTPVASVQVSPATVTLDIGQQATLTATAYSSTQAVLSGRPASWASSNASIATVSAAGVVTAVAGGTATVTATIEGQSASATVTVNAPPSSPVKSVVVTLGQTTLDPGQSTTATAVLKDAKGKTVTGPVVTWTSLDTAVAKVTQAGVVSAHASGTVAIVATSEGVSGAGSVTVSSAPPAPVAYINAEVPTNSLLVGQSVQTVVILKDANGNILTGRTIRYSTDDATIVSVSASGVVTGMKQGTTKVRISSGELTDIEQFTVSEPTASAGPVTTISVSAPQTSLDIGGVTQASAVARDAQGTVVSTTFTWTTSAPGVATVSSSGVVTAVGSGSATITAASSGVTGSVGVTVSTASAPPPPPSGSSVAELPRVFLNFPYPAKTGQTIVVGAGGNLQNALNSAQRGDEIVLTAGATYTGNFVLPAKSGTAANGWIVLRSDKSGQLPAIGTRVTPSQAGLMAKIQTANTAPAIRTAASASGWRLVGLEVTISGSVTAQNYGLLWFGEASSPQTSLSSVPSDLVLERSYVHGQPTTELSRCVALHSARSQVSDSYLDECHGSGYDSQAIWGANGPGPYRIVNNTLKGAGENIMFGGSIPGITGMVPSDIEIRQNYLYTPLSWKGVWQKKNLLELKNSQRVLIEGNVLDGSWTDGQTGWAVIVRDDGCSWCASKDVTIQRNLIRNAGAGINIAGPLRKATARILARENVLDSLGVGSFTGDKRGFQILSGTQTITLERNLLAGAAHSAALWVEGGAPCGLATNVWARGQYGVIASGYGAGTPSLEAGCSGNYTWSAMTMIGASHGSYPTGTTWVSGESQAPLAAQLRTLVLQATAGVIK
jgi:uncharacterized protein YjdB